MNVKVLIGLFYNNQRVHHKINSLSNEILHRSNLYVNQYVLLEQLHN